jgi:hypothetical protein
MIEVQECRSPGARKWVSKLGKINSCMQGSAIWGQVICENIFGGGGGGVQEGDSLQLQLSYRQPIQDKENLLTVLRIRIHRIRMFLGLLKPDPEPLINVTDSDPLVRVMDPDLDPSIIKQKIVRKTLIPIVLWLFYDFLSLIMYLQKVINRKTLKIVFLLASWRSIKKIAGSGTISQRRGSGSVPKCHRSATLLAAHIDSTAS